jgi:hypothetical protein
VIPEIIREFRVRRLQGGDVTGRKDLAWPIVDVKLTVVALDILERSDYSPLKLS